MEDVVITARLGRYDNILSIRLKKSCRRVEVNFDRAAITLSNSFKLYGNASFQLIYLGADAVNVI